MAEQSPTPPRRGILLGLAAEGMVPVLGGCAGALAGGPDAGVIGGLMGVAVGQAVEKAINFFGARIVRRWGEWFRNQPPEARQQALAELASLPPEEARQQACELIDQLALEPLHPADRAAAVDYLSLLPGALDRALPRDVATGGRSLPATISLDEPQHLLALLPVNLPPYPVGSEVPGTPYRLEGLLGSGGFGAVYRASTRSLQHLPLAIKFCLDPTLAQALHRERSNLERLMKAGGENWSPRIVRLYGYDLEHATPYLVYEYVTGGDLTRYLAERRDKLGRPLNTEEVLALILQVAEALAFAHETGLVHRDLKPANVLVEGGVLKLADFGLGGVNAARTAQVSRIGATTIDQLSVADQATLFRGAGTPLYMSPEQRRGQAPDPRHDLYSLGVMWYQLLVGDVSRELHPGWAKELALRYQVPRAHIDLIERCVGWFEERPHHAGELLTLLRDLAPQPAAPSPVPPAPPPVARAPETVHIEAPGTLMASPAEGLRESLLHSLVRDLDNQHAEYAEADQQLGSFVRPALIVAIVAFFLLLAWLHTFWGALFGALVLSGLAGTILYLNALGRRGDVRNRLGRTIGMLKGEFPEVIRSWGGDTVLHHPETVRRLRKQLGIDPPPPPQELLEVLPAQEPGIPSLDATSRRGLVDMLRQLLDLIQARNTTGTPRPFPLPVALVLGGFIGLLGGFGIGNLYHGYRAPMQFPGLGFTRHMDHRLGELSEPGYFRQSRQANSIAVACGIAGGLLIGGFTVAVLTRRRWYRRSFLVGGLLGVLIGCQVGLGIGMLHEHFAAPYPWQGAGRYSYYDASGREIDQPQYMMLSRQASTTSVTLGVCAGALVLFLTLWLTQRWSRHRAEAAAQQLRETTQQLATRFPQVVLSQGGIEAFEDRDTVVSLLREVSG